MELKKNFVKMMCESGMLRFGEFKTKAGRMSPYFINSGLICRADHIKQAGELYAQALQEKMSALRPHLFGPAYKGIPLVNMTASGLADKNLGHYLVTYNRKEAKDHGEKGQLIGAPLQEGDRVTLVEDVVSRGTSVRDCVALLGELGVTVEGLLVGVDRMELGFGDQRAALEIANSHNIQVESIVSLDEVIDILSSGDPAFTGYELSKSMLDKIASYRSQWGA